jgi:hypothetical protein
MDSRRGSSTDAKTTHNFSGREWRKSGTRAPEVTCTHLENTAQQPSGLWLTPGWRPICFGSVVACRNGRHHPHCSQGSKIHLCPSSFVMARPKPLQNLASGRSAGVKDNDPFQSLTPRTPHSRMGLAEEGGSVTRRAFQTEPLLLSSASDSFPENAIPSLGAKRKHSSEGPGNRILHYLPLALGSCVASALLVASVISWAEPNYFTAKLGLSQPATLQEAPSDPSSLHHHQVNSSEFISYENYTRFPLLPMEYRHVSLDNVLDTLTTYFSYQECHKYEGDFMMSHSGYWEPMRHTGPSDVPHTTSDKICTSTITYQLDGFVGLSADIALLAQVAALAREVSPRHHRPITW